jgi:hypothetical protein
MGCNNTKTIENKEIKQSQSPKVTESNDFDKLEDKKVSKSKGGSKHNTENKFILISTKEMEDLEQHKYNAETENFTNLKISAKEDEEIIWRNLVIDDQTFLNLINALAENEKLQNFIIDGVEVTGALDTLINLARILMKKTKLKVLEFISLSKLGNKKAKSLAQIMNSNSKVERLVLKEIDLQEEDAEYLGAILKQYSSNLKYFEISLVFFNSRVEEFLKGLQANDSIEELILNKINLNDLEFKFLVSAISTNQSLLRLDVSNNPIKSGVSVFSEFIDNFNSLTSLQMNNCDIDDECFLQLVEGIKKSKSLKLLELNNNNLTEHSAETVKIFFDDNKSLESLYILNNQLCKRDLMSKLDDSDLTKIISEY